MSSEGKSAAVGRAPKVERLGIYEDERTRLKEREHLLSDKRKSGRSGYVGILGILVVLGGAPSGIWSCTPTKSQVEKVPTFELPEVVTKIKPEYPDSARSAGVKGTVLVRVLVGEDGHVKDAKVVKSIPMLDASALAAVRQWVFKPALSNNIPVAIWIAAPVRVTPD